MLLQVAKEAQSTGLCKEKKAAFMIFGTLFHSQFFSQNYNKSLKKLHVVLFKIMKCNVFFEIRPKICLFAIIQFFLLQVSSSETFLILSSKF